MIKLHLISVSLLVCVWLIQVSSAWTLPGVNSTPNLMLVLMIYLINYNRSLLWVSVVIFSAYCFDMVMGANYFYFLRYALLSGFLLIYLSGKDEQVYPVFKSLLMGSLLYEFSAIFWHLPHSKLALAHLFSDYLPQLGYQFVFMSIFFVLGRPFLKENNAELTLTQGGDYEF